ncbi:MAG TPA: hypothetical protein VFU05_10165 [Cyclobacteriaceae bacterium]|nr:hypothetical protein [Cyclobacteriaceae bacterium]
MNYLRVTLFLLVIGLSLPGRAQEISQYDRFQLQEGELYWQHNYEYKGSADSLRQAVEKMLKSKDFTFSIIRGNAGFSGKINHYKVNPKRYGRTYTNTPKMYWDGEWAGKFMIEVGVDQYQVTIYEIQFKSETQAVGHHQPAKVRSGNYINVVTTNKKSFLKSEFTNLSLISLSFKDNFDLTDSVENSK